MAEAERIPSFLDHPGSSVALEIVHHDWTKTSLGPIAAWPVALRTVLATMLACPAPMFLAWGPDLICFYNDSYRPILGYRAERAIGEQFRILWASVWSDIEPMVNEALAGGSPSVTDMKLDLSRAGISEESYWSFSYSPAYDDDGRVNGMLCVTGETTARVVAERERQAADKQLDLALAAGAILGTWFWDIPNDRFTVDEAFARNFGLDPILGRVGLKLEQVVATVHPDDQPGLATAINETIVRGGGYAHQYRVRRADGRYYWIEANGRVEHAPDGTALNFLGVLINIENRRTIEAERDRVTAELRALNETLEQRVAERTSELMRSETQLRQLQKMEAVGQLTGGIAHDFNNMLAIIIGGLNLTKRRIDRGETDVARFIDSSMEGATRAAALTQRLLAFSRQQPLAPETIDLNKLVASLTDMLTRSLGETVQLETVLGAGLWKAKADINQLENVLVNLAVNARDAMPDGGRLTIETSNANIDDDYAHEAQVDPGRYLMIAVTDTGTGMTPDVVAQAFDPFFTTKAVGKGTGLGLSQVYGFLRQSGGHVKVYSEPGHGTTVRLYLPRALGDTTQPVVRRPPQIARGGKATEIVLVVEDEDRVRRLSVEALRELGYTALHAASGPEALAILERGQDVTLLFTDVVMPEMTGRQLVDKALALRPALKVIYTTGYTRNAVVHNGIIDPDTNFLAKPFSMDQLAIKIRDVLDR